MTQSSILATTSPGGGVPSTKEQLDNLFFF